MEDSVNKPASKRAGLTRTRVLRAAIRIADRNGIESLSMRKLAQALGVEAMSLYNHVANKEDVFDAMVEIVAAKISLPTKGEHWKSAMRHRAISAHEVLLSHPWGAMLFVSRINVGPVMLRYVDTTIGSLYAAGFSYAAADRAWNAIDNHIYGFTLQALNFPFQPSEYGEVAEEFLPQIPEDQYPHINALSRLVISGEHDGMQDFCFGLDLILDGLERLHEHNLGKVKTL
ncbi:MAG: AcrR family transcriptional regulator [Gammaproteobacteria bacterium]|jgi:AcrR family transcriptional regulator